jgi:hypothetical protein
MSTTGGYDRRRGREWWRFIVPQPSVRAARANGLLTKGLADVLYTAGGTGLYRRGLVLEHTPATPRIEAHDTRHATRASSPVSNKTGVEH